MFPISIFSGYFCGYLRPCLVCFAMFVLAAPPTLGQAPVPPSDATTCIYPPASSIAPCECLADSSFNVWLYCFWEMGEDDQQDILRFESILNQFDTFTSIYVLEMTCDRCWNYQLDAMFNVNTTGRFQFTYITVEHFEPSGFLEGQNQFNQDALLASQDSLKFITIHPFHYIQPSPQILKGMEKLEQVRLYGVDIGAGALPHFPDTLNFLSLSNGRFGSIKNDTFAHLKNLEVLYFDQSEVTGLAPGTFGNLTALTHLSLTYNNITNIPLSTFHHLPSLHTLDLGNNHIELVEDNFSGVSSSVQLLLDNNQIKQLAEKSFRGLLERMLTVEPPAAPLIDLANNPLECGCDVKWLIVDLPQATGLFHNARCYDGQNLQDVDPELLIMFCPK